MNDPWSFPPVEPGKLTCVLCKDVIPFYNGNTNAFFEHIETDHKVFVNHWLLLSIIFLDNETLEQIRIQFRNNLSEIQESGSEDLAETSVGLNEDESDDDSFGEDSDEEFDEDTKEGFGNDGQNKVSDFVEDFYKDNAGGIQLKTPVESEVLPIKSDTPKYKPGPKSFKIKQQLENDNHDIVHPKVNANSVPEKDNLKDINFIKDLLTEPRPFKNADDIGQQISEIFNIPIKEKIISSNNESFHSTQAPVASSQKPQFELDDTLPPSWKSRKTWREYKKTFDIDFMSPDGKMFRSRVKVVEQMKLTGIYSDLDYDKVLNKKVFDSIQKNIKEDLPIYKPGPKSRKNKQLLKIEKEEQLKIEKEEQLKIEKEEQLKIEKEEQLKIKKEEQLKFEKEEQLKIEKEEIQRKLKIIQKEIEEEDRINEEIDLENDDFINDDWSKCEDLFKMDSVVLSGLDSDVLSGSKRKSTDHKLSTEFKRQKFTEPIPEISASTYTKEAVLEDEVASMLQSYNFDENLESENLGSETSEIIYCQHCEQAFTDFDEWKIHEEEEAKSLIEGSKKNYDQPLPTKVISQPSGQSGIESMEDVIKNMFNPSIVGNSEVQKGLQNSDEIVENSGRQQMAEEIESMLDFDIFNKHVDKEPKLKKLKNSTKGPKQRKGKGKDLKSTKEDHLESAKVDQSVANNTTAFETEIPSNKQCISEPIQANNEDKKVDEVKMPSMNAEKPTTIYPKINVETSEYFRKRPNQLSGYNIQQSLKDQFVTDQSLPIGWKIRKTWRENKKNYDTEFLSPDGRKARSRVAVVEYMKLMGIYTEQDYLKIMPAK